uniref:Uncharacterized protein n=1 Tax=Thermodesulfobacterium geofontis TaxID=1295609 RepID=A0A7V6CEC8_9BACT
MEKYGVLYPESGIHFGAGPAHYKLCWPFQKGYYMKDKLFNVVDSDHLLKTFKDEIERNISMLKLIIISSENFMAIKPEVVNQLLTMLFGNINLDKFIVVYFRRQDLWMESSFIQSMKMGLSKKINEIKFHPLADYYSFIFKWGQIFKNSNIIPRIYDRSLFPEGNVILDFLSVLGIDIPEAKEYKIEANPSLSHISTLALRKINEQFSLTTKEKLKVFDYLFKIDQEEGPGHLKTFFTLDERIEFLERFRESNERLFREWFNSENKFVLTPEEIEFYKEQDKIPKDEIERLVEERYQKVVENVIKKLEAKPRVYIPVELSKLVKEGDIVEKVVIGQLYLDLLKGSKLVVGGVVVLKPEVKEEYRLLVEDAEGIKEVQWGLPSPGYANMYPDNPYAKNARFRVEGVVAVEEKPIRLYLENKNGDKILIYEIKMPLKEEG